MDHICPLTGEACNHLRTISITEITKNKATRSMDLCNECGVSFLEQEKPEQKIRVDDQSVAGEQTINVIATAAELMEILLGKGIEVDPVVLDRPPCPQCGLTIDDFNRVGKFGCATCYDHYMDEFLALAGPFQDGADQHHGKVPRDNSPTERLKLLKLKYAKALELERYEELASLKKDMQTLNDSLQIEKTSEDQ